MRVLVMLVLSFTLTAIALGEQCLSKADEDIINGIKSSLLSLERRLKNVTNQETPIAANVDVRKVVGHIRESLTSTVHQLIKDTVEETVNKVTKHFHVQLDLIEKQLNEAILKDQPKATDCTDLLKRGSTTGVHTIYPDGKNGISAYCDMSTDGGGWTVFQKRIDWKISFNRSWTEYENGFGNVYTEYWLGNKYIYQLTTTAKYELRVDLNRNGVGQYAVYKTFMIGESGLKYRLTAGTYEGNLGEALTYNSGAPFSTFDQDNERDGRNLAMEYGAWWYHSGSNIWLNHDTIESWWGTGYVGKKSVMMIRKIK